MLKARSYAISLVLEQGDINFVQCSRTTWRGNYTKLMSSHCTMIYSDKGVPGGLPERGEGRAQSAELRTRTDVPYTQLQNYLVRKHSRDGNYPQSYA